MDPTPSTSRVASAARRAAPFANTDPEHGSGGLHTPTFRGSDEAVPVGIRAMTHAVIGYLTGQVEAGS